MCNIRLHFTNQELLEGDEGVGRSYRSTGSPDCDVHGALEDDIVRTAGSATVSLVSGSTRMVHVLTR